ncbi:MAG: extracellular solute-binding protein [Treponema sp.]|jgi:raffinose/stachyose/melibiose transport system substrate-binding protein|nr:extracellular solute-binding protein [Treponema sp.]
MLSKTKIVCILLTVLVAASVFAGGRKDDGTVTLKVFYYLEATAPNAIADANLWFSTFEKNHPGVKIERENLFDEPFHDKLRAYAAAGELPDVMYVWPSGRSDYLHDQKLLKDLTPFVNRDNIRGNYLPLTMDPSQQQAGYLAMIPQGITTTHAFFINTEVLDACGLQPAKTYAELKAQVPVLRAKGYETIIIPAQSDWVMQSCLFSMLAGRFCGAGWEQKILSGQAKFTDPDFVAALDFVRQLYTDGVIQRSAVGMDYGEGPGAFATNKSAYYIDGDWRVGAFLTDSDTGQALISPAKQEKIKIGVFPTIEGAKLNSSSSVILGVGYAISSAIPAGSAKEAAAWELVKWMTGKEVSELRTERGGTPTPSRTDLNFAAMKLEPMQKAIGNLGNEFTTATVVIDGVFASEVYLPINTGLIEIAMGTRTPQQVAADVQRAYDTWKAR